MSFRCGGCGKNSKPGEKAQRKVVETRVKIYPPRELPDGKRDPGGTGTEIVKEVLICPRCK